MKGNAFHVLTNEENQFKCFQRQYLIFPRDAQKHRLQRHAKNQEMFETSIHSRLSYRKKTIMSTFEWTHYSEMPITNLNTWNIFLSHASSSGHNGYRRFSAMGHFKS